MRLCLVALPTLLIAAAVASYLSGKLPSGSPEMPDQRTTQHLSPYPPGAPLPDVPKTNPLPPRGDTRVERKKELDSMSDDAFRAHLKSLVRDTDSVEEAEGALLSLAVSLGTPPKPGLLGWIAVELDELYSDDPHEWSRAIDAYVERSEINGKRALAGAIAAGAMRARYDFGAMASDQLGVFFATDNPQLHGVIIRNVGYMGAYEQLNLMVESSLQSWRHDLGVSHIELAMSGLEQMIKTEESLEIQARNPSELLRNWYSANLSPRRGKADVEKEVSTRVLDFTQRNMDRLDDHELRLILAFWRGKGEVRPELLELLKRYRPELAAGLSTD